MLAVVQRVSSASVEIVEDERTGKAGSYSEIGGGLLVLLAVEEGDGEEQSKWLAPKIVKLRIFPDDEDKMNRSLLDVAGEMLVVSQFTLLGNCRKGTRPSFTKAAKPEEANRLYEHFCAEVRAHSVRVETGVFAAKMKVSLVNEGPVTLIVERRVEC